MSTAKKYYWLKLKRDFFKRHDITIIEAMPNGKDYVLFYLKLLVESIDHDGELRFSDTIPYNVEMLAAITKTNIDVVRSAVKVFSELGMMDQMDDGTLYMRQIETMLGDTSSSTDRVNKFRQKQKLIEDRKIPNIEKHINNKRYGGFYYQVLERDSYACSECDSTENIRVHHIIAFDPKDDDTTMMQNLVTLCGSCHAKLHNREENRNLGMLPSEEVLDRIGFDETFMKRYNDVEKRYIDIRVQSTNLDLEKDKNDPSAPSAPPSSKKKKTEKHKYGEHQNVLLSDDELEKLKSKCPDYLGLIEFFSNKKAMKGYTYKSDYLAILDWPLKTFLEERSRGSTSARPGPQPVQPRYPAARELSEAEKAANRAKAAEYTEGLL